MIFLKDKNTGCLSWGASMGLSDAFVSDYTNQTVNLGEGLTDLIAKTGKTIFIPSNASHDSRIARPVAVAEGFNSFIGVPIYASGIIVGVMNILTRLPDILKEDETKLIAAIGSQVGSTIQNALLFEERMLAEEKIILQNEYLNSIMESLTHPFYVIDANDHTIKMANSASGFGPLTRESKCYSLTHRSDKPCDEPEHPCTIREIKRTNKPVILEHIHYDNKGNTKVIEVHGYPIYDKEGKVVEVIEYTIDITERKKQEEELLRFSNLNAIGRLAVGIAHEINNPLTNASLGMQILKKKFFDITDNKNILQKFTSIENSVDRASIIAKELLEFSRHKDIELSPSNINDLIHGALTLMEFKFSNVKIHKELADLPEILGNPVKLEHVFLNVLSNSAEAMPDGGDIFISTSFVNSEVIVKISDTGVGISKENISEVFEPFFRKKEVGDGTGLGLAISYSIIKQHNGNMEISSTKGKSTTVTINLPETESHE
jgi:PAS domain S-box-containing protein